MLTTAGPCFSTSSVKSGSCAETAADAKNHSRKSQRFSMVSRSFVGSWGTSVGLSYCSGGAFELQRIGYLHDRGGGCLPERRHHVIRNRPRIDVDRPLVRERRRNPGTRQRLYEHRYGGEAVRE